MKVEGNKKSQQYAAELRARIDSGDETALEAIRDQINKYAFYHNIPIVEGIRTKGHPWADGFVDETVATLAKFDLRGKRVLDIGCRDGAQSFAAEEMGAAEVISVDRNPSEGLINFLIPFKKSRISLFQMNVNDLSRDDFGEFDVVLLFGVLYHLRYPMWVLNKISQVLKPGGILIIEGGFIEGFADLPILFCPVGKESPFDQSSVTFFNQKGLSNTLLSLGFGEVTHHKTFRRSHDKRTEREYLSKNFPEFFKKYSRCPELSICRKILSCTKATNPMAERAVTIPRRAGHTLKEYWDGCIALTE